MTTYSAGTVTICTTLPPTNRDNELNETKYSSFITTMTPLEPIRSGSLSVTSWNSEVNSSFSNKDQFIFDSALFSLLDIISSSKNLSRIKDYEAEFKMPSRVFYERWKKGNTDSNPKFHDWASTYKRIIQRWPQTEGQQF